MEYKHPVIPPFTRRDPDNEKALLFSGDGELHYLIPENYFDRGSAVIVGAFVRLLGSFSYRIISASGKVGDITIFNWPTAFLCRPSHIEKARNIQLDEKSQPGDYRILIFEDGDQLVSDVFTPQDIDNTKELLSLHIMTGKIPRQIPYDQLYMYPYDSMQLNGNKFDIHVQMMAMIYSKLCRDPDDVSRIFRLSKAIDEDLCSYIPMSVKDIPKYISPYASITSENIDEGILSSVILSDEEEKGKKHTYSPLEQVLTM